MPPDLVPAKERKTPKKNTEENASDLDLEAKSKKKRKREDQEEEPNVVKSTSSKGQHSGMDRKPRHRDREGYMEGVDKNKNKNRPHETDAQMMDSPDNQPPKKKRKNKTGFPDPSEDSALTDQAKKALLYAFTQFNRPSKWKFQKARQNWLIRNVWSSETVPEVYFSLVLQYLSKVQGGTRENLLKSCQSAVETASIAEKEAITEEHVAPEGSILTPAHPPKSFIDVKQLRGKLLLEALEQSIGEPS